MKKKLAAAIIATGLMVSLVGCRESDRVSYNLSKQADNFNVVRQLTVVNAIQGDVLFQMTGKLSIEEIENQLEITVEDGDGTYKKHFVGLSDNVTYVVEQKSDVYVDKYQYTLNYNPKMWIPVEPENID
ncbi:hypothetical protein EUAN_12560 [Andreesenia angusta]|uniref:Uncharacterized protein n=1 Tax=Andreesenia angusta TaxID=39480 RepID=A0A1S1V7P9_9FIRM|nr:hypothetical protein [Andreesenia angusta]OHW62187.1 hypothetical protein EUAN_12560 [Andreesenia angusta]